MNTLKKEEVLRGIPLSFEKNCGYIDKDIKYSIRTKEYNALFLENQIVLCLMEKNKNLVNKSEENIRFYQKLKQLIITNKLFKKPKEVEAHILKINLNNSYNSKLEIKGQDKLNANITYQKGNDESNWIKNIEAFKRLIYKEIYKSIDLVYYEKDKRLAYDFIVKSGANPKDIRLTIENNSNIKLNKEGDLEIKVNNSKVLMRKPKAYQIIEDKTVEVESKFILSGRDISFQIGKYNTNIDLIIDPILIYETYLGGNDEDNSNSIAVDEEENIYITGRIFSIDFPLKNPIEIYKPSWNIFVSKINKYGKIVFSTYLGGRGIDEGTSIAIDDEQSIYITGNTNSDDFPVKNQIYDYSKGFDVFICKIRIKKDEITSEEIGELVFSTYLGGYEDDYSNSIYLDSDKNVYVTGGTYSEDFPLVNQIGNTIGKGDIFISKIKINEREGQIGELLFSTTLGSQVGLGKSIYVDDNKNIYVAGYALSSGFPLINQIHTFDGSKNIYLIKINPNDLTNKIKFATYISEYSYEEANSIKVDKNENIYIAGYMIDTESKNRHAVVYKISNDYKILLSKKIEGDKEEVATALEIDEYKNIYVTGYTTSDDFILENELFYYNNKKDAFVLKIDLGGNIVFSTYLGGSGEDISSDITVDKKGCIYITGNTDSTDISRENKIQDYMDYGDIFVSKIEQGRYLKIGDINLVSRIKKNKISMHIAQNLTCYINDFHIENFGIKEEIKEMEVDLGEICTKLKVLAYYKEISIKPQISFSIALIKGNCCANKLKIYTLEEGYISEDVYFGCTSLNDDIPESDDFEVIISASYDIKDIDKNYYTFYISGIVGLLYR
ncbi:DUF7948 domain-containing protein [Romboutsia maritimum]|nr:SBBP repeat-containing protein [Romboutsia maritimum]